MCQHDFISKSYLLLFDTECNENLIINLTQTRKEKIFSFYYSVGRPEEMEGYYYLLTPVWHGNNSISISKFIL